MTKNRYYEHHVYVLLIAALLVWATGVSSAWALSHAGALKAPLTVALPECSQTDVDATTLCPGAAAITPTSPWTFSQGTVEFGDGTFGLRLDDIELQDGEECPGAPNSGNCQCWNTTVPCDSKSDCGATEPNNHCGPNSEAGDEYFKVEVYRQGQNGVYLWPPPPQDPLYPEEGVRRDGGCKSLAGFKLKHTGSNKNRQVNKTYSNAVGADDCSIFAPSDVPVSQVRHIQVLDQFGAVVAVMAPEQPQ